MPTSCVLNTRSENDWAIKKNRQKPKWLMPISYIFSVNFSINKIEVQTSF